MSGHAKGGIPTDPTWINGLGIMGPPPLDADREPSQLEQILSDLRSEGLIELLRIQLGERDAEIERLTGERDEARALAAAWRPHRALKRFPWEQS